MGLLCGLLALSNWIKKQEPPKAAADYRQASGKQSGAVSAGAGAPQA